MNKVESFFTFFKQPVQSLCETIMILREILGGVGGCRDSLTADIVAVSSGHGSLSVIQKQHVNQHDE